MGLADTGRAQQGDVGVPLDELKGRQVADLARLEVGLEGESNSVRVLWCGSRPDTHVDVVPTDPTYACSTTSPQATNQRCP